MNLASFDLNLLKAADALFSECSVTRAADRTGVTQQAMSGQLRRLRDIFDDVLLQQSGRTLVLTPMAEALRGPIADALIRIERALVATPAFLPAVSRRVFNVSTLNYAGSTLMPHVFRNLMVAAPRASIVIQSIDASFVRRLDEARTDVCVCNTHWRVQHGAAHDDIRIVPLFEDDYVCVVDPESHPGDLTLKNYLAAPHAVVNLGANGLTSLETAWIRHCYQPRVVATQPNFVDILFMLPKTGLVAVIQRQLARRWAVPLGLKLHPVPFDLEPVRMEMAWHARDDADPGHVFLRNVLMEEARNLTL